MLIKRREDHTFRLLFRRTFSAQIHLFGAVLMILGAQYLLPAARSHSGDALLATWTFVVTGVIVFLGSFLFHFLTDGYHASTQLEEFLEKLDHFGIYLFIAGTYSAFMVAVVAEPWKTRLLITIWVIAVAGIVYTFLQHKLPAVLRGRLVYTGIFVVMGWTILIRAGEIVNRMDGLELLLFLGGALSYTLGAVVFYLRKPSLFRGYLGHHEIWHLMVVLGAFLHFLLIYSFYSPDLRSLLDVPNSQVVR